MLVDVFCHQSVYVSMRCTIVYIIYLITRFGRQNTSVKMKKNRDVHWIVGFGKFIVRTINASKKGILAATPAVCVPCWNIAQNWVPKNKKNTNFNKRRMPFDGMRFRRQREYINAKEITKNNIGAIIFVPLYTMNML